MARKKAKQQPPVPGEDDALEAHAMARGAQSTAASLPSGKKSSKSPRQASVTPASSSLIICRNKHWRHISSFHGAWLQMPTEILETIANINYNAPRPRPIDPAILFDLLKIRKNVDEAADLAVRAASDIVAPTLAAGHGGIPGMVSMNSFGLGLATHGTKLSRERRFRMRELASQKLARAYRLDEIASSVATMQGASTLEEVAALVLQHNPDDCDAKYVHFFHEKIPSRHLAESTRLQPLQEVMSARAGQPEVLRTLATVKIFKNDLEGAAHDLTEAMSLSRFRGESHRASTDASHPSPQATDTRRRPLHRMLAEDHQPSGLDAQLLFQRGCVYLSLATLSVPVAMPLSKAPGANIDGSCPADGPPGEDIGPAERHTEKPCADDDQGTQQLLEARKSVKSMAKRALRDLMAFLSQFDYSPDLPVIVTKEFMERVYSASHSARVPRWSDVHRAADRHMVYPLSELFSAVPPANLPTYPSQEVARRGDPMSVHPCKTCEWVTYHPLLTEALHSLLLAHCLAQTSAKELQRHAYMVARLVRLCDGYPVFQASRSPARTDWAEVNRRAKSWLSLCDSWDSLCFPAPLPVCDSMAPPPASSAPNPARATAAVALINGVSAMGQAPDAASRTDQTPADSIDRQVALGGGRLTPSKAPEAAGVGKSSARGNRALPATNSASMESTAWGPGEDGREHAMATERSACIARWVTEVPLVTGTRRRKRVKKGGSVKADATAAGQLARLDLEEAGAAA